MPGLCGNEGGTNRKFKELYANVNGVDRKLKEMYANVNGVDRKIYSGFSCKAHVIDSIGGASHIKADGSGKLGVWSSYSDNDPQYYHSCIDFYFNEPLEYVYCPLTNSDYYGFSGTPNPKSLIKFCNSQSTGGGIDSSIALYTVHSAELTKIGYNGTHKPYFNEAPQYGLRIIGTGSAVHFQLRIDSKLYANSSYDDTQYIKWDGLVFLGKQINSIELI